MEERVSNCRKLAGTLCVVAALAAFCGCGPKRLPTAPVQGKVLYQGKPLEFGGVLFQPENGPLARGKIGADGTFRLSTYREGDGAVLGTHRVQVACYETQRPGAKIRAGVEPGLGKPLIPPKYLRSDTSGLQVEIREHNEPVVFDCASASTGLIEGWHALSSEGRDVTTSHALRCSGRATHSIQ